MSYWSAVFTLRSWAETRANGLTVVGFRPWGRKLVARMQLDDEIICYLKGQHGFVGLLKVTGDAFESRLPRIWSEDEFPIRVPVVESVDLAPENRLLVSEVWDRLSYAALADGRSSWGGFFQGSPRAMIDEDGRVIENALRECLRAPRSHPLRATH